MSAQVTSLQAWSVFLRAHAALTRELSARLEAEHGLSLRDFDALAQLHAAPRRALRRVDLARQVLLTASGITRLLDGLERAGWVEKAHCDSDARVSYAVLTGAGAEKFEAARATHGADVEELFGSRLSESERAELETLLAKLPLAEPACPTIA